MPLAPWNGYAPWQTLPSHRCRQWSGTALRHRRISAAIPSPIALSKRLPPAAASSSAAPRSALGRECRDADCIEQRRIPLLSSRVWFWHDSDLERSLRKAALEL